mmetsp:Transcript_62064/g.124408  ORF Transcript_62064/g.124408 Transcript_62064/m.124408 type:complete len:101 (-) Transcript_62064:3-305(-)
MFQRLQCTTVPSRQSPEYFYKYTSRPAEFHRLRFKSPPPSQSSPPSSLHPPPAPCSYCFPTPPVLILEANRFAFYFYRFFVSFVSRQALEAVSLRRATWW